jgi:hypothetical protein
VDLGAASIVTDRGTPEVPGIRFYSLQLGPAAGELEPHRSFVSDLGPDLYDWTETATALRQLDLLISIDSGVANLAGVCRPHDCPRFRLVGV